MSLEDPSFENSSFPQHGGSSAEANLESETSREDVKVRQEQCPGESGSDQQPHDCTADPYEVDRRLRQERRREFNYAAANEYYTLDANMALVAGNILWAADYLQDVLVDNEKKRGATIEGFKMVEPVIQLLIKANREMDKYSRFATRNEDRNSGGSPA